MPKRKGCQVNISQEKGSDWGTVEKKKTKPEIYVSPTIAGDLELDDLRGPSQRKPPNFHLAEGGKIKNLLWKLNDGTK